MSATETATQYELLTADQLVAQIVPGALTENDPVSFRHTLFRIAVGDAQGRDASVKPPQSADSRGMEER